MLERNKYFFKIYSNLFKIIAFHVSDWALGNNVEIDWLEVFLVSFLVHGDNYFLIGRHQGYEGSYCRERNFFCLSQNIGYFVYYDCTIVLITLIDISPFMSNVLANFHGQFFSSLSDER